MPIRYFMWKRLLIASPFFPGSVCRRARPLEGHRCSYFCQIESTLDTDRVLLGEPVLVLGGEVVVVVLVSFEL